MGYLRFFAMIATSTVVTYGLMYFNTYETEHIWFSQTRAWMALLMGSVMAVIMLLFMWSMYPRVQRNLLILAASLIVFSGTLWLVRSQETVSDVSWMKAMIPHHSIAILTSRRAELSDPRVRKLADEIIEAQVREIGEMENLIAEIDDNGEAPPDSAPAAD